jgi:hypothetical protein
MEKINLTPYTISTATTGSCAFVELDVIKVRKTPGWPRTWTNPSLL